MAVQNLGQVKLVSIKNSKYLGYVQIEVRNANGALISITESDTIKYYPFSLTDEYFDETAVTRILEINGINYEEKKFEETYHAEDADIFIGRVTLSTDKIGYDVNLFSSFPHGFTVEDGDVAISHWTILRQVT